MEKKRMAVIYCCSSDSYAHAVATSIMSFEKTNPELADNYVIFCDRMGLTEETRKILKKVSEKILFRDFSEKEVLGKFLDVRQADVKRFSYLIFAKVFCIDYLKSYKNVLFLGADTIVVSDISELLNTGPLSWLGWQPPYPTQDTSFGVYTRPNGDFIFMNDSLEKYSSADLINLLNMKNDPQLDTITRNNFNKGSSDEAVYGMFALLNKIKICEMSNYLITPYAKNFNEAKLVHAHHCKFWQYPVMKFFLPEYQEYYQKWLSIGGKAFDGERLNPANFPAESYEVLPYLIWMETLVRFGDILYDKLPNEIQPSLAIYNKLLPFYIHNKKRTDCFYYVYRLTDDRVQIGFEWGGVIKEEVLELLVKMAASAGENYKFVKSQKRTYIFREYGGIPRPILIPQSTLQKIATDFLDFINSTLHFLTESPLGQSNL